MTYRVVALVSISAATLLGLGGSACSSSSSSPTTGSSSGAIALAAGPCTVDTDCTSSTRGDVGCFIGGGGGGGDGGSEGGAGDGGSTSTSYCSLKCSPPNGQTNATCSAPFLGICNMKGFCKLH